MSGASRRVAIVGPTAVGKSALAMEVASRVSAAEIVSLDSMQVYRRMTIGTAKATWDERRAVRHHNLDLVEPWQPYLLGDFLVSTREAEQGIESRGGVALLVGGSGLHQRAVVDRFDPPGQWPAIRAELDASLAAGVNLQDLWAELLASDPDAARKIEPSNPRRIVRALEVIRGSGRPFSSFGSDMAAYAPTDVALIGIDLPRAELDARIAARVHAQLLAGWVEEVAAIESAADDQGLAPFSATASQAIGYSELSAVLAGSSPLAQATAQIIAKTRRFARRQQRWFRRDPRITWFDATNFAGATTWLLRNLQSS